MARKIIDTYPELRIALRPAYSFLTPWDRSRSRQEADEFWALVKRHVLPHFDGSAEVETHLIEEATCEHCNYRWTEESAVYNGGCCGKDEANSPERLAALQTLIDDVEGADLYRWDADHGRDRVKVDWPWALACAADAWLKAGRPADHVEKLKGLIRHVQASDWCTLWQDPGPSGCSLARLADRVEVDVRPDDLATELTSLIDDMGLSA
jgi:hypothetical protein